MKYSTNKFNLYWINCGSVENTIKYYKYLINTILYVYLIKIYLTNFN